MPASRGLTTSAPVQRGAILPMSVVNWSVWSPLPNPGPCMRKKSWLHGLPVTVWAAAGLPIEPAGGGVAPVAKCRKGPTSPVRAGLNARATPAEAGMRALSRVKLITPGITAAASEAWSVSTP